VSDISNSGVADDMAIQVPGPIEVEQAVAEDRAAGAATTSRWYPVRRHCVAIITYLLDSGVHTFAFSVAANAILSFIPFIVLLFTLSRVVFHSEAMVNVVSDLVRFYMPSNQEWVAASLEAAAPRHGVQIFSLVMILVACTGIFLPLEVALNQAWGVEKSRNYLYNQAVALGLALLMVVLAVVNILLSAGERMLMARIFFHHTHSFWYVGIGYFWLSFSTGVASILFFFSIYWILPHRRVPWQPVLRTSIVTGLVWLGAKYLFMAMLPHLQLKSLYGPFYVSVGLLFWAYASGLILFAGAEFSVSRCTEPVVAPTGELAVAVVDPETAVSSS
jgi:membrane protein